MSTTFLSDANKWVIDLFDMKVLPDPRNRIKTFVTYAFYTSNWQTVCLRELCSFLFRHIINPRKIWKKCGSSILVIGLSNRPSHEVDIFPISLYQSEKPFVYGEFSFLKSVWMIALKKPCRASCVGVQACEEFVFAQFFSWGYRLNNIESCHYILW